MLSSNKRYVAIVRLDSIISYCRTIFLVHGRYATFFVRRLI
ncbi:hypothetical protein AAZX31_20G025300 [Glycine max]